MRPSRDNTLATFANRAGSYLKFDDDAQGTQATRLKELAIRRTAFRGVTQVGAFWVVRITIAGEQIVIGRFEDRFPLNAVRYADCAIAHFWKYRPNPRKLDDADLTLGLELIAAAPLSVGILLEDIEAHLKASGKLSGITPREHTDGRDPIDAHRRMIRAWRAFLKSLDALKPEDAAKVTQATDAFKTEVIDKIEF